MARRRVRPQPTRPVPAARGSPDPIGGRGPTGSCAGRSWRRLERRLPQVWAVPPVRNTSECRPASAGHQGIRPGSPAPAHQVHSSRRPRRANVRKEHPVGHQAAVVEGDLRSGWSLASFGCSWPGDGFLFLIPDGQEHFPPSAHRDTHIFGGLGLRNHCRLSPTNFGSAAMPR